MVDPKHYTYRVTWSEEDQEFVALCAEFPSLSYLAEKNVKALSGIMKLVEDIMADMIENGEEIPLPLATKKYSGKFMVRIPSDQHRHLAIRAAESGVSLNRYVSSKLLD